MFTRRSTASTAVRDFFMHLLTITVGLFIASESGEYAAEALHHRHQREEG